jgi:hypothetical protein
VRALRSNTGIADFSLALQELEAVMPLVDEVEPNEALSTKAIWTKSSTTSWLPLRARRCVMIWRGGDVADFVRLPPPTLKWPEHWSSTQRGKVVVRGNCRRLSKCFGSCKTNAL